MSDYALNYYLPLKPSRDHIYVIDDKNGKMFLFCYQPNSKKRIMELLNKVGEKNQEGDQI